MSQVEQPQAPDLGAPGDATMDAAIQEEIARLTANDDSDNAPDEGQADPDSQSDEQDATTDGSDEDADAQGDAATVDIEFNGKTYAVPEELKEGFMLKQDYTRKTMEVAETRKQQEAASQHLAQLFQVAPVVGQYDAALSTIASNINEIQQYLSANPGLMHQSPGDYAKLTGKLTELNYQGQTIYGKRNEAQQQFDQFQSQQVARRLQEGHNWLAQNAPKMTQQERKAVGEYAAKSGYLSPEALQFLDTGGSPGALILLDKARKFDELMAKKPGVQQKVQNRARSIAPGAAPQAQRNGSVEAMGKRLRNSGSVNDAVALELSRMGSPRRR